jgi:hypothetical protein
MEIIVKFKKNKQMRIIIILLFVTGMFFTSCEIDNRDEPNGGIYGTIVDNIKNEPLQSEQPNGFQVILEEKDMPTTIRFWGKPNGTFENTWIFPNEYKVKVEGAFFPVEPVAVTLGTRTEVNFTVTPFLALTNVEIIAGSGEIISNYKIERSKAGDKIVERKTLVSDIPTVNNSVFIVKAETSLSDISDEDILATQKFTDVVSGLESGKKYYVRVAAKTVNSLNRYNYSNIFEVEVP